MGAVELTALIVHAKAFPLLRGHFANILSISFFREKRFHSMMPLTRTTSVHTGALWNILRPGRSR